MKKILYFALPLIFFTYLNAAHAYDGIYFTVDSGIAIQNGLPSATDAHASSTETKIFPSAIHASVGYNHDIEALCRKFGVGLNIGLGRFGKQTYYYSPSGASITIRSRTLEFLGTGVWHIKQFDIFGEAGGIRQTIQTEGIDLAGTTTEIRPQGVIGTAFNFNPHLAVTASYGHIFGSHVDDLGAVGHQTPAVNEYLFGLRFTF